MIVIMLFAANAEYRTVRSYTLNKQRHEEIKSLNHAGVHFPANDYKLPLIEGIYQDPIWVQTGSFNGPHNIFTTTLLPNGDALVVGSPFRSLYDCLLGTWRSASIGIIRNSTYHTATLLPNGFVLIAGGEDGATLKRAEIYDSIQNSWTATRDLNIARRWHTATLLPDGKVLIAGGDSQFVGSTLDSAELYDPNKKVWTTTGKLTNARRLHSAVLLHNGKVLVFGGYNDGARNSAELYDPSTGSWRPTGSLKIERQSASVTLLPNGKVLVTGGISNTNPTDSVELYDPISETWSLTGYLINKRVKHTATLLNNGKVLVVGGDDNKNILKSAELYDPSSGKWTLTSSIIEPRHSHTATLLSNGKVLVAGGAYARYYDYKSSLNSAELYDTPYQSNSLPIATNLTPDWVLNTMGSFTLLVTGLNFTNGSIVRWNDSDLPTIFVSSSQLICSVSGSNVASTGDVKVNVYSPSPGGGISNTIHLPIVSKVINVSAASYASGGIAPESLIATFGVNLAAATRVATSLPLPESLAGTMVLIRDSLGVERIAPLLYVSPTQINYVAPSGTAIGDGRVIITSLSRAVAGERIQIQPVNPSIFSANSSGQGVVAGQVLRIKADGSQIYELAFKYDNFQARHTFEPISLGRSDEQVFLILYGTGIRNTLSLTNISAKIGGEPVQVLYAGPQGYYAGLDQVNIRLPRTLIGRGIVDVEIDVNSIAANVVQAFIR